MDYTDKIYQFLKLECDRLSIKKTSYRIGNDVTIQQGEVAFDYDGKNWRVYIIERGKEYDTAIFESIHDAIRYFFMQLTTGPDSFVMPKINFKDMPDR
jgi:hypothetical protein